MSDYINKVKTADGNEYDVQDKRIEAIYTQAEKEKLGRMQEVFTTEEKAKVDAIEEVYTEAEKAKVEAIDQVFTLNEKEKLAEIAPVDTINDVLNVSRINSAEPVAEFDGIKYYHKHEFNISEILANITSYRDYKYYTLFGEEYVPEGSATCSLFSAGFKSQYESIKQFYLWCRPGYSGREQLIYSSNAPSTYVSHAFKIADSIVDVSDNVTVYQPGITAYYGHYDSQTSIFTSYYNLDTDVVSINKVTDGIKTLPIQDVRVTTLQNAIVDKQEDLGIICLPNSITGSSTLQDIINLNMGIVEPPESYRTNTYKIKLPSTLSGSLATLTLNKSNRSIIEDPVITDKSFNAEDEKAKRIYCKRYKFDTLNTTFDSSIKDDSLLFYDIAGNIAKKYDSTATYMKGDYCFCESTNGGIATDSRYLGFWKCRHNITTPRAFYANDWEQVILSDELKKVTMSASTKVDDKGKLCVDSVELNKVVAEIDGVSYLHKNEFNFLNLDSDGYYDLITKEKSSSRLSYNQLSVSGIGSNPYQALYLYLYWKSNSDNIGGCIYTNSSWITVNYTVNKAYVPVQTKEEVDEDGKIYAPDCTAVYIALNNNIVTVYYNLVTDGTVNAVSKISDGANEVDIHDSRLTVTSADIGKVIGVNENGELALINAPSSGGTKLYKHHLHLTGAGAPGEIMVYTYSSDPISKTLANEEYVLVIYNLVSACSTAAGINITPLLVTTGSTYLYYLYKFNNGSGLFEKFNLSAWTITDTVTEL